MPVIYSYMDEHGRAASFYDIGTGLRVLTNTAGAVLPDDEIPNLVASLQHYMSKRAREVTHEHKFSGQKLRHSHPDGNATHGYYDHPEDGARTSG